PPWVKGWISLACSAEVPAPVSILARRPTRPRSGRQIHSRNPTTLRCSNVFMAAPPEIFRHSSGLSRAAHLPVCRAVRVNHPGACMNDRDDKVRLDKWLWAARFFKTRALAKAAIESGKVQHRGERCKPGREPKIGEEYRIRCGYDERTVRVLALSDVRRGAPE